MCWGPCSWVRPECKGNDRNGDNYDYVYGDDDDYDDDDEDVDDEGWMVCLRGL